MTAGKTQKTFTPVKADVNLPELEEEILKFWDERKIFEKSVHSRTNAKSFSFYDGPPFATGLPHYGHILAGTLKDIVPRYWTMKGYSVERRFGWDCHGLPVEYEINKNLKITSNKDVYAMGVDKYNAACRSIVQRYSEEWKRTVRRVGRWVDMENAYFTMNVEFMESVWWVFQQLFQKGLIYEGYKVVPYSTGLSTVLSNFEANLNYKNVQDPALTVSFPLLAESQKKIDANAPSISLLAWTTTPWTLPSNLALAVGNTISYVRVREKATGNQYIAAETLWKNAFGKKAEDEYEIIETTTGDKLVGLKYEPLFSFFSDTENAFRVVHSDHVTIESGTGIVHLAPAFGEDDYFVCKREGIPLVNPIDDDGMFTSAVPPYAGKRVKEADKDIIMDLKAKNRLVKNDSILHSYPFCWRTDQPLIYRAVSSWFVKVEAIKEQLLKNNSETRWVPDHLRDGRFGKWLENARDWAVSRNRFWGTPLPIWRNEEGEILCLGSKEELEKLSGKKVDDLHMDVIDSITIPSPTGKSPLKRVESVLDCWFESGSMPYAQWGYPRGNVDHFERNFPADFIAEGLDQTRGWFYTLMVIGTALFGKAPFKNVVVNGLVLAEDGKKMSKSLKNYPDPLEVLNKTGADALRLYMIDSPVVKAEELKFSEKGVNEVVRKIMLRWWNAYSFFVSYANIDQFVPKGDAEKSENLLDQWILSKLHSLIDLTQKEMEAYRLYNVVPPLLNFIEELTNTYIRFNRPHFWKDGMPEDKRMAFETLHHVLETFAKVMAPFTPFLAEVTYQNLSKVSKDPKESVHLEDFPVVKKELLRTDLEEAVKIMDALVTLGRNHREKIKIKAKIPLLGMKIIHREKRVLENLKKFEPYFKGELNIRSIEYVSNEDDFILVSTKANFPALGKRLGGKMKAVGGKIQALPLSEILKLEKGETLVVDGEAITISDVEIRRAPKENQPDLSTHQLISIWVDPSVTVEQENEGLTKELMRKIQQARKAADYQLDNRISLRISGPDSLKSAVAPFLTFLQEETLTDNFEWATGDASYRPEEVELEIGDVMEKITLFTKVVT
jgi:isoleucyl-tRNA synthetase